MKTIMCFGDSLTWGYNPASGARFPFEERWPGVLQKELGSGFHIIEEALNGRTMFTESELLPQRSGTSMLELLLESHAPIDMFILMLGTNDAAPIYRLTSSDIAACCPRLIRKVEKSQAGPGGRAPEVLLIAPPLFGQLSGIDVLFYGGGEEVLNGLADAYRVVADAVGCAFLDAGSHVKAGTIVGVHLDAAGHRALAMEIKKIAEFPPIKTSA